MVETPPPKKHKISPMLDPKQTVPHAKAIAKPEADSTHHLSLNEQAGPQGLSIALDAMTRMANLLNVINSEV